ncbi:MAG: hypothetical protein CMM48_02765 [Rhodospirillaceae bacterium]|nr:hypothetical protein [Rhodospirillaceae bacterium]HAA91002.1 hypothetical protein [Rhodospirillaceae bacterium]|tara:strand:+ start:394 stop:696 length:303 start_codon:yes stop_codon:yes gene_type:complete
MDGFAFLTFLRKDQFTPDPEMPTIVITGMISDDVIAGARDLGANEIMPKPFTVSALKEKIEAVLSCSRPFISKNQYVGPCRRRNQFPYRGRDRREFLLQL